MLAPLKRSIDQTPGRTDVMHGNELCVQYSHAYFRYSPQALVPIVVDFGISRAMKLFWLMSTVDIASFSSARSTDTSRAKRIPPHGGSNIGPKKKPNNPLILRGTLAGPCKGILLTAQSFRTTPVTLLRHRHFPQEGVNFRSQSTSSLQISATAPTPHLRFRIG